MISENQEQVESQEATENLAELPKDYFDVTNKHLKEAMRTVGIPTEEDYDRAMAEDAAMPARYDDFGPHSRMAEVVIHREARKRIAKKKEEAAVRQEFRDEGMNVPDEPEEMQWDEKKLYALELVLGGMQVTEAAMNSGFSRRTIHRWMQSEWFQTEQAARKRELAWELRKELPELLNEAWKAMDASLRNGTPFAAVGVLRALGILDGKLFEGEDGALEEVLGERAEAAEAGAERETAPMGNRGMRNGEYGEGAPGARSGEQVERVRQEGQKRKAESGKRECEKVEAAEDGAERVEGPMGNRGMRNGEYEEETPGAPSGDSVGHVRQEGDEQSEEQARQENLRQIGRKWDEVMGHVRHEENLTHHENETLCNIQAGDSLFELMNPCPTARKSWQKTLSNPAFRQGMKAARERLRGYWRLRARHLAKLAVANLRRELQEGNGRIALAVLKGMGVMET